MSHICDGTASFLDITSINCCSQQQHFTQRCKLCWLGQAAGAYLFLFLAATSCSTLRMYGGQIQVCEKHKLTAINRPSTAGQERAVEHSHSQTRDVLQCLTNCPTRQTHL